MINTLEKDEIGLVLLINRLKVTQQDLSRETIIPFAELKLPKVAKVYYELVNNLMKKDLIEGGPEQFVLTSKGLDLAQEISHKYSLHAAFYDEYYQALQNSEAHALFCERVYGQDLSQHGMADLDQIQSMLNELDMKAGMSILDFGCGDGRITEYISDKTKTRVVGIDIADQAIKLAQERTKVKKERMRFYWADIDRNQWNIPQEKFDRIIAIDSLFFARDQKNVFEQLFGWLKPGGKMAVFYISRPGISSKETALGKILSEMKIEYYVIDFSKENTRHWKKKKQALLELEHIFEDEDNMFLFRNRIAECNGIEHFQRYLYVISGK